MSIKWTISHPGRLVTATLSGAIQPGDVERYLAEIAAAGGMPYAKIMDLKFAPGEVRLVELKAMMRCAEQYAKSFSLGPIAIVVDSDLSEDTSAFYGERTKAERPCRTFREMSEATAWLAYLERSSNMTLLKAS